MLHRQFFEYRAVCARAAMIAMFVTSGAAAGGGSDDCANAQQIAGDGLFPFDNSAATTDGLPDDICFAFGADQIEDDVWFCWTASSTGNVVVETCGLTTVDTKIAAYAGCTCPTGNGILDCNDDTCGLQSRITFHVVQNQQYLLRIGTFPGASGGTGSIRILEFPDFDNDSCADAQQIAGEGVFPFDNSEATTDGLPDALCDTFGADQIENDVWFCWTASLTGNVRVETCGLTAVDTKIAAYDGCSCPTGNGILACNDDTCGLQSQITFSVVQGQQYLLRIGTFPGGDPGFGSFDIQEFVPTGACCLGADCFITTAQDCAAQRGGYQGDGTSCGGLLYPGFTDCANPFEDISGTGIEAPNASNNNDAGDSVPIGFTFNFYGDDHTEIGVSSNGYLTFGADLTDPGNDAIPNTIDPNDLIAPLWDDFNPSAAGTVHYQTKGKAPNRRFIAQWTDVPQVFNDDSNTFQAILFEGSNCIEFRYGIFTPEGSPSDYTIGIENQDGSDGVKITAAEVFPGDCRVTCQEILKNPCIPLCPGDPDATLFFEPDQSYLSEADSPLDTDSAGFILENFEDGLFNMPGVSVSGGEVRFPGPFTDSVDLDDGVPDGFGTDGHSFLQSDGQTGITFTFDAKVLGQLPTQAGLVWTDGNPQAVVTFTAEDAQGICLVGTQVTLGDGVGNGTTAEDRFLGVAFADGIGALSISTSFGGLEIDHVQFVVPCPWDVDGNGSVGATDLLLLLSSWGTDPGGPPDFDGDGNVGATDLLALLVNWGPCP